jgi:hypothetical protein
MNTPAIPQMQQPPKKKNGCMIALAVIGGIIVLGLGGCMLLSGVFVASVKGVADQEAVKQKERIATLATAAPSELRPDGDLRDKFTFGSEFTDVQRENTEKEITGKIVEWTLTVYEVRRSGDNYEVSTIESGKVGTDVTLHPQSDSERQRIEALKEKDVITVRGYIKGTFMRDIAIDPAILVR